MLTRGLVPGGSVMRSSRIGLVLPALVTIGCFTFAIAVARAQTQPAPQAQAPNYQAPPGMQQPMTPPPPMQNGGGDDAYRGYNGNNNGYGNDFPSSEVNIVPGARANAVRARLEMEQIQTNMHRWIDRSWDDFMHSREYADASAAE